MGNQAGAGFNPAAVKLLMVQHGAGAAMRAAQRADELLDEGNVDGCTVRRRILEAIGEIMRDRREGEAVN